MGGKAGTAGSVAGAMGNSGADALRKLALSHPGVEEGTSCTKRALRARGKAFVFIGASDGGYSCMVKLAASREEAEALARKEPAQYRVGGSGWVTATLPNSVSPPVAQFKRWIDESYRLLVPGA